MSAHPEWTGSRYCGSWDSIGSGLPQILCKSSRLAGQQDRDLLSQVMLLRQRKPKILVLDFHLHGEPGSKSKLPGATSHLACLKMQAEDLIRNVDEWGGLNIGSLESLVTA